MWTGADAVRIVMRVLELLGLQLKPSKALIAWMREPGEPKKAAPLSLEGTRRERPHGTSPEIWYQTAVDKFFKTVEDSTREGSPSVIATLDSSVDTSREYKIVGSGTQDRYIQSLTLQSQINLTLSDLSIKTLTLGAPDVHLRVSNCSIRQLDVHSRDSRTEIRLYQSNVGTLNVVPGALSHYEMHGGSLLNVVCPPPGPNNPFSGTVSFTPRVFFPRERDTYILAGPQPYRNMRYHLRALENVQMANLFHSAELAVERKDDSWTNHVVSYLYELTSDFGSSVLRPFLWLSLLYVSSVYAIFCSDGAEVPEPSGLVGWQHALIDPAWGEYTRAFYLALQSFVNPVGIFGLKYLLVPKYTQLAAWLSVDGFIGLILLALLIFAIRRRFRIQA